jgi:cell division protein FtsN
MGADFKKRAAPKPPPQKKASCLYWFLIGTLVGGFMVGLLWLQLDPALWRSGGKLDAKVVPRPKTDTPPPSDIPMEFEFPQLLRDMQLPVLGGGNDGKEEPKAPKPPPKPVAKAEPSPPAAPEPVPTSMPAPAAEREAYLLQIGSFRKAEDAERLKAQLALLGVETRIQRVTINDNDTFHRVRSGPYRDLKSLDRVRQLLTRNNIKSIVVRWQG